MPKNEVFDRQQVLDAGMNLFWKKGFNGASMQDVVDATGLGRSSIYNSFGSKQGFFKLTLKYYQDIHTAKYGDLIKGKSGYDAIEAILDFNVKESYQDFDNKGCFMVNTTTELAKCNNEWLEFIRNEQSKVRKLFTELLERGIEDESISQNIDVKKTSTFLYNTIAGLRVSSITSTDKNELNEIIKMTLKQLK